MEALDQKLDRVSGDVQNVIALYDYAEKLYPYENIRKPFVVHSPSLPNTYSSTNINKDAMLLTSLLMAAPLTSSQAQAYMASCLSSS